jgi:hypothetical protein
MPIRRGAFATPAFIERGRLRRRIVGRIADDPTFGAELRALYDTHVAPLHELPHWVELPLEVAPRSPAESDGQGAGDDRLMRAYVDAARALAARWGLDRLIEPRRELGAELIVRWCQRRRTDHPGLPVQRLVEGLPASGYIAEIGEMVSESRIDLGGVTAVDPVVRPIVHIAFDDEWDPERQRRSDARRRLMQRAAKEIRRELDRLQEDAEAKGYVFTDARPMLERDVDWLFQLMTGRATLVDISARTARETRRRRKTVESGVHQSVHRIAKRAGVSIRGWGVKSVGSARRGRTK